MHKSDSRGFTVDSIFFFRLFLICPLFNPDKMDRYISSSYSRSFFFIRCVFHWPSCPRFFFCFFHSPLPLQRSPPVLLFPAFRETLKPGKVYNSLLSVLFPTNPRVPRLDFKTLCLFFPVFSRSLPFDVAGKHAVLFAPPSLFFLASQRQRFAPAPQKVSKMRPLVWCLDCRLREFFFTRTRKHTLPPFP